MRKSICLFMFTLLAAVTVRAAEVTVEISFSPGLEDCIYSIFDRTNSQWLQFEENRLNVEKGTDLQVNFKDEDYIYEAFYLDDANVTSEIVNSHLRFIVEKDVTIRVEGKVREYPSIEYKAYIKNPEGVRLYLGGYLQNSYLPENGEPMSQEILLPATEATSEIFMSGSDCEEFELSVATKRPYVYISPRDGWYIYTVQGNISGRYYELPYVMEDTPEFFVVAYPFDNFKPATFDVIGDASLKLTGSAVKSRQWGNPELEYQLTEGINEIEFLPDFNLPLSVRAVEEVANMGVFLDGAALIPDENGIYSVMPWYDNKIGGGDMQSTVTVVCNGQPAKIGRVNVTLEDGIYAECRYSVIGRELKPGGQSLLVGTPVCLTPSTKECTIIINDKIVNGYDLSGQLIEGLSSDGTFEFEVEAGSMDIVIMPGLEAAAEFVSTEETRRSIWSIDGTKIQDPECLTPGLHIINGRKVMIKE